MRIGIVSDSHGQVEFTRNAVRALGAWNVELVLHCGDIGSVDVVALFAPWPTHFVFGNVDRDETELRQAIRAAGQTCHGRFGSLQLQGCRIAFLHSDDMNRFRETVIGNNWDLICYGHTHVAEHHQEGSSIVLNPGALSRARPHSLAVVELPSLEVTLVAL